MIISAPRGCSCPARTSIKPVTFTSKPVSSIHSRSAAQAGSSPASTKPAGKVQKPLNGSTDLRTNKTLPFRSIKTPAATLGSEKYIHSQSGQVGRKRSNRIACTRGALQRGQYFVSESFILPPHDVNIALQPL